MRSLTASLSVMEELRVQGLAVSYSPAGRTALVALHGASHGTRDSRLFRHLARDAAAARDRRRDVRPTRRRWVRGRADAWPLRGSGPGRTRGGGRARRRPRRTL